jgi:hypothetical protein
MIINNILFSLVTSSFITLFVYLFNRDKYKDNKNINDLIIIFIVSFIVNFIGKICIYEKDTNIPSIVGSNMKEVNNVCPF